MQPLGLFVALGLIAVGAVLMISPIPFGAVLLVAGLSLLLAVSARARRFVRRERTRHPKMDELLAEAEEKSPHIIAAPLEATDGPAARALHAEHAARHRPKGEAER